MARGSVYEGRTFEEAVRNGLDDLRLSRAEATITLIEEGKGGFLGFGSRPFRVSIMRRPGGAMREPEEQRERRVSGRREERRGGRGGRGRDRDRDREGQGGPRRREEGRRGPSQPARAEGAREESRREGRRDDRREGRREERREGRRDERREERPEERREERRPAAAAPPAGAEGGAAAEESMERRRRRRGRRGGRGRRREGAPGAPSEAEVESTNGVSHEPDELETHEAFEPRQEFESGDAPVEPAAEPAPASAEEPVAASASPAPAREVSPIAVETREEAALASGELAEQSRRLTEELLRAMGFEATIKVVAEGNRADVTAEIAKDDDLLTGQKGEVRQALQHLLNRFINRGDGSRYHLQLEINDFWARREDELRELAHSLADRAVNEATEVVTDYLNSQERRIVHVTLKEDPRVKTYALGTGMIKRVAVAPAGFPERTGEEDAG